MTPAQIGQSDWALYPVTVECDVAFAQPVR